ncbi:MAG: BadF/BadG/BcrA/BcrD ATPase family protein [Schumannella sp.]
MSVDRTIVAIDGGNSKTDVVLLRGDGEVLSRARSGPFVPHLIGAEAAVDSLDQAVAAVLVAAGLTRADHIAAYLANADLPAEEDAIRDAMIAKDWAGDVVVENDTLALLRAGTLAADAVAVVCGAGINCVGVASDGARVRYPALGRITGDWGGGLGLAKEVLWSAARHEDGRGPATALTAAVAAHFGRPTAVGVSEALHLHEIP